ncbi:hypothetical protein LQ944_05820 [Staphylococcus pasteuri]|uniref:hypothetical protein n=1 Tax=Staphylococcus pasteuri TaxID=45972 RepID=UPI001E51D00D|nr:hypothetical protein [Staphylococcus pasteuri]MCD9066733.1 hypothetical protein [Staphylococcus pasteuri]WAE41905.1 hypothetical protein LQ944_05820 [Staphylococcus pasteuri]
MKKLISVFILALVLCLAGCSNSNNDKDSHKNEEKKSESKAKSKSERFKEYDDNSEAYEEAKKKYSKQKPISMLNKLDPIMTDKTFTNKKGMQGWKDYKKLMDKVKLADYKYTKESKGSSLSDVDAFFKDKKDVKRQKMDAGEDGIKQVNYWYVTGSGKKVGNTNYPEYYTEIMTKYKEGKLVYASVEPGLYHVSFSDAVENKDSTKVKNLKQLLKLNQSKPIPYSVAEMKYEALPVTNVSVLVKGEKDKDEKSASNYLAYFNFSPVKYDKDKNHEVVSVNGAPFESAQADFGNYAYVAMKEALKEAL